MLLWAIYGSEIKQNKIIRSWVLFVSIMMGEAC